MKLAAASATDQGLVRSNNEDAFLIDDQRALFAVADGMGGHRGGEVASHTAIEALRAAIANGTPLHDAITRANTAVLTRAAGDDELTGMGTTMTAVIAQVGMGGSASATPPVGPTWAPPASTAGFNWSIATPTTSRSTLTKWGSAWSANAGVMMICSTMSSTTGTVR